MKRRIIWLVILPWSGVCICFWMRTVIKDGMLWRQLTFEWVPRGDRFVISPASGGDFLLPCLTFLKGVTSSRIFVEYHRWKYFRFWEFYAYLLMCWQVFLFTLFACLKLLLLHEWIVDLYYRVGFIIYFVSVEFILKVANPCSIHWGAVNLFV